MGDPTPTLLILHGPPAVGKYTIGQYLAKDLDWPLFHNHLAVDLALTLFPFGSPAFVAMRERIWMQAFELSMARGQSLIFTFAWESTVPADFIERLVQTAEESGGRAVFVSLVCAEDSLEARMNADSRQAFAKLTDVELYRKLRAEGVFEAPPLPEPLLVLDTDQQQPEASSRLIATAIRP